MNDFGWADRFNLLNVVVVSSKSFPIEQALACVSSAYPNLKYDSVSVHAEQVLVSC